MQMTTSKDNEHFTNSILSSARYSPDSPFILEKNYPSISDDKQRSKVIRKVNASHIYFLDYYTDIITYMNDRKLRYETFMKDRNNHNTTKLVNFYQNETTILRKRRIKPQYRDFQIISQIGQGGFGQVFLTKHVETSEICALKIIKKKFLLQTGHVEKVLTERDILKAANPQWLVPLLYSFQDDANLYLAMEFIPGGDYRSLLLSQGVLSFQSAKFYASEMFAAVNSLHELGFIHRDLKPENFLIDSSGHIKLTDFGLASGIICEEKIKSLMVKLESVKDPSLRSKSIEERKAMYKMIRKKNPNSLVGSAEYIAIEVLLGEEYESSIDFWSIGCILYETLTGVPPFSGENSDETYINIRHWEMTLIRPQVSTGEYIFSDNTWDLINCLITSPSRRLKFEQIKKHDYFHNTNWDKLQDRESPFVPQLLSEADPGYFDDFSNEYDMNKYKDVFYEMEKNQSDNEDIPVPKQAFIGFTFKRNPYRKIN